MYNLQAAGGILNGLVVLKSCFCVFQPPIATFPLCLHLQVSLSVQQTLTVYYSVQHSKGVLHMQSHYLIAVLFFPFTITSNN